MSRMDTRNKLLSAGVLVCILVVCVWATMWSNINSQIDSISDGSTSKYDVRVLIHLNDQVTPTMIKSMLSQLPEVTGLQFDVWVGDNTTGGIMDATARISMWLSQFTSYSIVIQCDYAFEQTYGYYQTPFWIFNSTETLSQEWYNEWYGNLSQVVNQYPNVILMVGLNEPYNHFSTKAMAQTIMEREYLTWKNLSRIPFTVKLSMPYLMWADWWNFPKDIEADYVPFWANYSDYIGMDLWADSSPPQDTGNVESIAFNWVKQSIAIAENYSVQLKKPIFIGEYPAWDPTTLTYISNSVAKLPNIGQVYQLWYWSGETDLHQDAYTYGIFNVDPNTLAITTSEPEWTVFNDVFNQTGG